jgi:hypothetical protein
MVSGKGKPGGCFGMGADSRGLRKPNQRPQTHGIGGPPAPWGMGCRVWAAARCLERNSNLRCLELIFFALAKARPWSYSQR